MLCTDEWYVLPAATVLDEGDNEGKTAIHWAVGYNLPGVIRVLYEEGASIALCDKAGAVLLSPTRTVPLYWVSSLASVRYC